jgi:hypothetical protein
MATKTLHIPIEFKLYAIQQNPSLCGTITEIINKKAQSSGGDLEDILIHNSSRLLPITQKLKNIGITYMKEYFEKIKTIQFNGNDLKKITFTDDIEVQLYSNTSILDRLENTDIRTYFELTVINDFLNNNCDQPRTQENSESECKKIFTALGIKINKYPEVIFEREQSATDPIIPENSAQTQSRQFVSRQ